MEGKLATVTAQKQGARLTLTDLSLEPEARKGPTAEELGRGVDMEVEVRVENLHWRWRWGRRWRCRWGWRRGWRWR